LPSIGSHLTKLPLVLVVSKPHDEGTIGAFHAVVAVQAINGLHGRLAHREPQKRRALADPITAPNHVDLLDLTERREEFAHFGLPGLAREHSNEELVFGSDCDSDVKSRNSRSNGYG
jgi:hypothetical protein